MQPVEQRTPSQSVNTPTLQEETAITQIALPFIQNTRVPDSPERQETVAEESVSRTPPRPPRLAMPVHRRVDQPRMLSRLSDDREIINRIPLNMPIRRSLRANLTETFQTIASNKKK